VQFDFDGDGGRLGKGAMMRLIVDSDFRFTGTIKRVDVILR